MKEQDCLRRFLFEKLGVRGEWVRLNKSWQESKQNQQLDNVVQEQLGQMLAASVLLSATIKFEGSMILQAQGDGALRALVAQSTHDRKVRGLARSNGHVEPGLLSEMMGEGRLVITVEPETGKPYQGVVALDGQDLAEVIGGYFLQSEQLETRVWLFANESYAAGLFLQELPAQESYKADWERISILADTVTKEEMLSLDCEEMLYRLFNEEKVRLFPEESVKFECTCSRQKVEKALFSMGRVELESILQERNTIEVDCEFCGGQQIFDKVDVETILATKVVEPVSNTRH